MLEREKDVVVPARDVEAARGLAAGNRTAPAKFGEEWSWIVLQGGRHELEGPDSLGERPVVVNSSSHRHGSPLPTVRSTRAVPGLFAELILN